MGFWLASGTGLEYGGANDVIMTPLGRFGNFTTQKLIASSSGNPYVERAITAIAGPYQATIWMRKLDAGSDFVATIGMQEVNGDWTQYVQQSVVVTSEWQKSTVTATLPSQDVWTYIYLPYSRQIEVAGLEFEPGTAARDEVYLTKTEATGEENYIQIDFTQKEWVPRVITVFPQFNGLDKNYHFFLATSDDKFVSDTHYWGCVAHSPSISNLITEMTTFASATTNYIDAVVSSSTNFAKYTYDAFDYKYKDSVRWQCNSIRIYPVISGSATDFNICDIKPVVQEIANEFYGEILNLSKNITIATAASGTDPAGSNVVILDKTGLTMYKGTKQVLDIGELDRLSGAMGMWIGGDVYIGGSASNYDTGYNIKLDDNGQMWINAYGSSSGALISVSQTKTGDEANPSPFYGAYSSSINNSADYIKVMDFYYKNIGGLLYGQLLKGEIYDEGDFVPAGADLESVFYSWLNVITEGSLNNNYIYHKMSDKTGANTKYFRLNQFGMSSGFPIILSSNASGTICYASGSNFVGFQSELRMYDFYSYTSTQYFSMMNSPTEASSTFYHMSGTATAPYSLTFNKGTVNIDSMGGITQYTSEPTGFVSMASSTMTFNSSTNVFTISPISGTFLVYIKGKQYAMPETNIDINSVVANGANYIYFDSTGVIRHASSFWDLSQVVPIAYIIYSSSSDPKTILCEERHGITMDWATHKHDHLAEGSFTTDAFTLGSYSVGSASDVDNNFTVAQGTLYDEDLPNTITNRADNAAWSVMYRDGTDGVWKWQTSAVPLIAGTYMCYNLASATGWGLASSTNGNFINMYIVAINAYPTAGNACPQRHMAIMGQTVHSTLTAAQSETIASISFGNMPFQEMLTLWQVTYKLNASYGNTGKCAIAATPVSQQSMRSPSQISATFTSHNALSGRDATNCHPLSAILNSAGDTFTNAITFASSVSAISLSITSSATVASAFWLPAVGSTSFSYGNADGAGYGGVNTYLRGWWGLGFYNYSTGGTYPSQMSGYIDFREGILDMKGDLKVNGNSVWHSGEFDPANYMPLAGCSTPVTFSSSVSISGMANLFYASASNTISSQTFVVAPTVLGVGSAAQAVTVGVAQAGITRFRFGLLASLSTQLKLYAYNGTSEFEQMNFYASGCVQVGSGTNMSAYTPFHVASSVGNTNAVFGANEPICIVSNSSTIAFNAYYNSSWKAWTGSKYGARIALDATNGVLYFNISSSTATSGSEYGFPVNTTLSKDGVFSAQSINISSSINISDGTNTTTIVPPFRTDKSKCNLLLDFDNTLIDKTRGIKPTGYSTANMWSDAWVNNSTTKATATNLGGTFKTFDGDRGKFGGGIAVEESRTNYVPNITNSFTSITGGTKTNSYGVFETMVTQKATHTSGFELIQTISLSANTYTFSVWARCNLPGIYLTVSGGGSDVSVSPANTIGKWERWSVTATRTATNISFKVGAPANAVLEVCGAQVEVGAFPTSLIITSGTAVTRPTGVLSYPGSINPIYVGSFSSWFKTPAGVGSYSTVAYFGNNASGHYIIVFFKDSDTKFHITINTASESATDIASTSTFAYNTWYHVAGTWDVTAKIYRVYINGVKECESTGATKTIDSDMWEILRIGYGNSTNSNFAVFNYALTAAEIKQIYYSDKPVICEGTIEAKPVVHTLNDGMLATNILADAGVGIWKMNNTCGIRGTVYKSASNVSSGDTLFTLSTQYRPSAVRDIPIATESGSAVYGVHHVRVGTDGTVKYRGTAGAALTPNAYMIFNTVYEM